MSSAQQVRHNVSHESFYEDDLRQMARATNYIDWQYGLVSPFLRGRVLEVGGGIGNFTRRFSIVSSAVTSVEPNHRCFSILSKATCDLSNTTPLCCMIEDIQKNIGDAVRFDAIVCLNVLEHIFDDRSVFDLLARLLAPAGNLVILVPAVPWAFGPIDERLGHYRRYSMTRLRMLLQATSLSLARLHYVNAIGLLGWIWNAKILTRMSQNDSQIALFDKRIVPVLRRVESFVHPPLGQSLFLVAENSAKHS